MSLLEALQAKKSVLKNVTTTEKTLTLPNSGTKNDGNLLMMNCLEFLL